jgi:hypothetical protein
MDRKTKIALWVEALLVALLVFSGVLLSYFSSVTALNTVLSDSGSYSQIAKVSQLKINEIIPEDVKSNPIAYSVINWGVNRFVTADLIEKLSVPTLEGLVKLSKTPTTIQGSNIVLDTTKYKTKLTSDINGFNIPQGLKSAGDSFVNALPTELKVVDLNKHPNSILAKVIKAKERLGQLKDIVLVLSVATLALAILIGVWSRENATKVVKALSLTTVAAGGATLVATGILALVVKYVPIYAGTSVLDYQINLLFLGLSNYFLTDVAKWGAVIVAAGLVVFIFTVGKVQAEIKALYARAVALITSKNESKKTKKPVKKTGSKKKK